MFIKHPPIFPHQTHSTLTDSLFHGTTNNQKKLLALPQRLSYTAAQGPQKAQGPRGEFEMDVEAVTKEALETIAEVMRSADSAETRRKAALDLLNVHQQKGRGALGAAPTEDQLERIGCVVREVEEICEAVGRSHEAVGGPSLVGEDKPLLSV